MDASRCPEGGAIFLVQNMLRLMVMSVTWFFSTGTWFKKRTKCARALREIDFLGVEASILCTLWEGEVFPWVVMKVKKSKMGKVRENARGKSCDAIV